MPYSQNSKIVHNYITTETYDGVKVDLKITPSQFFWEQMGKISKQADFVYENEVCLVFQDDKELESNHAPYDAPTHVVLLMGQIPTKDLDVCFIKKEQKSDVVHFCWKLKEQEVSPQKIEDLMPRVHQTINDKFFKAGFILPYGYSYWLGLYNKESDSFIAVYRMGLHPINTRKARNIAEIVERVEGEGSLAHKGQKIFRIQEKVYQQNTRAIARTIEDFCS